MNALLVVVVVLVGLLLPVQAGMNAVFRQHAGHPVLAAALNFSVGLVALLIAAVATGAPLPNVARLGAAPWWSWLGGLLGASLVLSAVIAAPRLGASLLIACLVGGQLAGSVLVDHFGWFGYAEKPLTLARLVGVALLAAGVVVVERSGSP